MNAELSLLAWAMLLGFAHIFAASTVVTRERGMKWNASARDGEARPLSPLAGRLQRAQANFLETFPFFAAAVLAVVVLDCGDATTALGAQCYFWARLLYVPVYAAGIPYVRTVIWAVSLWGLLQVLWALL